MQIFHSSAVSRRQVSIRRAGFPLDRLVPLILISLLLGMNVPNKGTAQCLTPIAPDTMRALRTFFFADSLYGFMVRTPCNGIYRTTTGGATWQNMSVTCGIGLNELKVFPDSLVYGLALLGEFYHSTNRGLSWQLISNASGNYASMSFIDKDHGIIAGCAGLSITNNGGITWNSIFPSSTSLCFRKVHMIDTMNIIAVRTDSIFVSIDGGKNWSSRNLQAPAGGFSGLVFADSAVGFVCGGNDIVKTSDGGKNWTIVRRASNEKWKALACIDRNRIVAVGSSAMLSSLDGGASWVKHSLPENEYSSVVIPAGSTNILASGYLYLGGGASLYSTFRITKNGCSLVPVTSDSFSVQVQAQILRWTFPVGAFTQGWFLEVSVDSLFQNPLVDTLISSHGRNDGTLAVKHLAANTPYHWRIAIQNLDGSTGEWHNGGSFTLGGRVIRGQIFEDFNRNAQFDPGELLLQYWPAVLSGTTSASAISDASGMFQFSGLDSGSYYLSLQESVGWDRIVPKAPGYNIDLSEADSVVGIMFGYWYPYNTVTGRVFQDVNEDGLFNGTDSLLSHWNVNLFTGSTTSTAMSDDSGRFVFTHVGVGTFFLSLGTPFPWERIWPTPLLGDYELRIDTLGYKYDGLDFALHIIPPRVKIPVHIRDTNPLHERTIFFGAREYASYGIWRVSPFATNIDFSEGEFEIPPPVEGFFDARFVGPRPGNLEFGEGSWTDMRSIFAAAQTDTYHIQVLAGLSDNGTYPISLSWSQDLLQSSYAGQVLLSIPDGRIIDMKAQSSVEVQDPVGAPVVIIAQSPRPTVLGIDDSPGMRPLSWSLEQNYPNPFNPLTEIRFQIPFDADVSLKVFDVLGREVITLLDGHFAAGTHSATFNGGQLSSGVYFYRIIASPLHHGRAETFSRVRSMLFMK